MFCLYININEVTNHLTFFKYGCERCDLSCCNSNGDIFMCENNMLFSHVKISCFRAKAHLVFHWCLYNKLWYVSLGAREVTVVIYSYSTVTLLLQNYILSLTHPTFLLCFLILPFFILRSLTITSLASNTLSTGFTAPSALATAGSSTL